MKKVTEMTHKERQLTLYCDAVNSALAGRKEKHEKYLAEHPEMQADQKKLQELLNNYGK